MSLEAAAGKNPINHVGKIYNVVARSVAERIYSEVKGIEEVNVKILSQIGKPINEPFVSNVQYVLEKGCTPSNISAKVKEIIQDELTNITQASERILRCEEALF